MSGAGWSRQRHGRGHHIPPHRDLAGYGTLILEGGYCEAGESGRWHVRAGMVIVHASGESHADWFGDRTTQLIDFAIPTGTAAGAYWSVDVDRLMAGLTVAGEPLAEVLREMVPATGEADWPDRLAEDIRNDASLCLGAWADRYGVRRETVSRGFLRAYGVSPCAYRLGIRVKSVLNALQHGAGNLAGLAADHGFSDQSHMTRAIRAATGWTPAQLRMVKSVQDRSAAGV